MGWRQRSSGSQKHHQALQTGETNRCYAHERRNSRAAAGDARRKAQSMTARRRGLCPALTQLAQT
jgi:hypothetical protein